MKPAAYLLMILLLGVVIAAQDSAKQTPSNDQASTQASDDVRFPSTDEELAPLSAVDNTCYTMRTYFFRPSEDGTVQPAGMTTCVKSNQRALKRAQKRPVEPAPQVRLVH